MCHSIKPVSGGASPVASYHVDQTPTTLGACGLAFTLWREREISKEILFAWWVSSAQRSEHDFSWRVSIFSVGYGLCSGTNSPPQETNQNISQQHISVRTTVVAKGMQRQSGINMKILCIFLPKHRHLYSTCLEYHWWLPLISFWW